MAENGRSNFAKWFMGRRLFDLLFLAPHPVFMNAFFATLFLISILLYTVDATCKDRDVKEVPEYCQRCGGYAPALCVQERPKF